MTFCKYSVRVSENSKKYEVFLMTLLNLAQFQFYMMYQRQDLTYDLHNVFKGLYCSPSRFRLQVHINVTRNTIISTWP